MDINKEIFEEQIAPKLKEIKKICEDNELPFFCYFLTDKENNKFEAEMLSLGATGTVSKRDKIPDFVNILNGFGTCMRTDFDVIDMDM